MNRFISVGVGMSVSIIAVTMLLGAGVASAKPPFYGKTYAEASADIKSHGSNVAIVTIIGSQLAMDDCMVTNAYQAFNINDHGKLAHKNTWNLQLNCTYAVAAAGKPGNSVTTPEGEDMKKKQKEAAWFNEETNAALAKGKEPWCGTHVSYCKRVCDRSRMCSTEVANYLSSL